MEAKQEGGARNAFGERLESVLGVMGRGVEWGMLGNVVRNGVWFIEKKPLPLQDISFV